MQVMARKKRDALIGLDLSEPITVHAGRISFAGYNFNPFSSFVVDLGLGFGAGRVAIRYNRFESEVALGCGRALSTCQRGEKSSGDDFGKVDDISGKVGDVSMSTRGFIDGVASERLNQRYRGGVEVL